MEQVWQSAREVNKTVWEIPERNFTFQLPFPTGGFWGVGLRPWSERKRTSGQILGEVQHRVSVIPGVQTFAIVPPALPGGGNFPVEVVILSTAEPAEILGFAEKIQMK